MVKSTLSSVFPIDLARTGDNAALVSRWSNFDPRIPVLSHDGETGNAPVFCNRTIILWFASRGRTRRVEIPGRICHVEKIVCGR